MMSANLPLVALFPLRSASRIPAFVFVFIGLRIISVYSGFACADCLVLPALQKRSDLQMTDTALSTPGTTEAAATMDIVEIQKILPHRYPFLLIDRVVEIQRKQRIVALKNVSVNEPFFAGHFPGYPIMPGVLMVEAMAQAGGALLLTEIPDRENKLMVFTGIERARFRRPVTPGDQVKIVVEVLAWRSTAVRMQGEAFVGDKLVAEAVITCRLVDRVATPSSGEPSAAKD